MQPDIEQLTPEQALQRGVRMVKIPSMAAFFVPVISYIVLGKLGYVPTIGYPGMKWALPIFALSLIGSWLIWSIQVPRWRLWAYRRVTSIPHLKSLAAEAQLIWPEGSFFERTEIMSRAMRSEIRHLEMAPHDA